MSFMDISAFKAKLKADIISAVTNEVKAAAEKSLREAVNRTMYASGGGTSYARTGDFLNAVKVDIDKIGSTSVEFTVYIEGSMLGPSARPNGEWNAHMDVDGNSWNDRGIVEVLDEGTKSHSLYMHSGYHFYQTAQEDMDRVLVQELASALRGRGWDVVMM